MRSRQAAERSTYPTGLGIVPTGIGLRCVSSALRRRCELLCGSLTNLQLATSDASAMIKYRAQPSRDCAAVYRRASGVRSRSAAESRPRPLCYLALCRGPHSAHCQASPGTDPFRARYGQGAAFRLAVNKRPGCLFARRAISHRKTLSNPLRAAQRKGSIPFHIANVAVPKLFAACPLALVSRQFGLSAPTIPQTVQAVRT